MWNFLKGVQPPKRKQTLTDDEWKLITVTMKRNAGRETFNLNGRKIAWLRVETNKEDTEVMFCDFCIKSGIESDRNAFAKGCSNFKLEAISIMKGVTTIFMQPKCISMSKIQQKPQLQAKLSLNKAIYEKLIVMFRTAHAINIQGRPARDYLWMNELDKTKGILNVKTKYRTNFTNAMSLLQQ